MEMRPYLFFEGRCDEAINFYRSALSANVTMLMRFKDSPESCSLGTEDKVMHASLRIGEATLLISDGRCVDVHLQILHRRLGLFNSGRRSRRLQTGFLLIQIRPSVFH